MTLRQLRWRLSALAGRWVLTRRLLRLARSIAFGALDLRDRLLRRPRPWSRPPRRLIFIGGLEFEAVGREFRGHLERLAGLNPEADVLDIGCGVGRMAVQLAPYLDPRARYEGFDVVPEGIEWCRHEITPRHPNFRFQALDVQNPRYNPDGRLIAAELRFPYEDESFDLVFATSVFTHMLSAEVERYLSEARRVLRPGGRLFATWYLLGSDRPRAEGPAGAEEAWFPADFGRARAVSRHVPEAAVGHDEAWVLDAHSRIGLEAVTVEHGSWLGVEGPSWQDILVARRN